MKEKVNNFKKGQRYFDPVDSDHFKVVRVYKNVIFVKYDEGSHGYVTRLIGKTICVKFGLEYFEGCGDLVLLK